MPAGADVRVRALLERLGFSSGIRPATRAAPTGASGCCSPGLEEFREHLGGELTITLLSDIGTGVDVHTMDADLIDQAIDWLRPQGAA